MSLLKGAPEHAIFARFRSNHFASWKTGVERLHKCNEFKEQQVKPKSNVFI